MHAELGIALPLPGISASGSDFYWERKPRLARLFGHDLNLPVLEENDVEIRAGYDIAFQCFQETPMILMLSIDPARVGDLLSEHSVQFSPNIPCVTMSICSATPAPELLRRPV
jgi:hypothetical protein